jgi:hypothetical protein
MIEKSAKEAFLKKLKEPVGEEVRDIWEISKLKELKTILKWRENEKGRNTRYMELGEFKKRGILPKASDVFKDSFF